MSADFVKFLEAMAEPFSVMSVEWKPGAITQDKSKALALAYVDSRAYIARLNALAGGDWSDEYQVFALQDRVAVICRLTIFGVTRTGDGEALFAGDDERVDPNLVTSASAQAFKRACVKFGLGAYLYDLPQVWCDYDQKSRRIVNPPKLPDWAVPFGERDAYKASHGGGNGNGNGAKAPTPAPAVNPAPAPTPTPSAVATAIPAANPANVVVHFGRYNGKTLAEIKALGKEGEGWLGWCADTFQSKNEKDAALKRAVKAFLLGGVNPAADDEEEGLPF